MAEFDPTIFSEATTYTPTGATLVLTFTDGTDTFEDTVELDPEWVAVFLKCIRTGDVFTRADGCLPVDSPELRSESKHHFMRQRAVAASRFQGWLKRKPLA
ncbi:MAG: hypothetical protein RBR35_09395 [Salinivirgaceae bacterium]|nr:hypothetical protein [Salinivirgaceae bacterium]